MSPVSRVTLAARAFSVAAVLSVAALLGTEVLRGALLVLVAAVWAQIFSSTGRISESWVAALEAAAVGVMAAATWPREDAVIPYLLVPALIGGVAAGLKGVIRVLAVEAAVTSAAWWLLVDRVDRGTAASVLTWLLAGMGLGFLGAAFRKTLTESSDASYRDALNLIKQLHALSGKLTAGLDSVSLAEQIMETASRRLAFLQAVVLVPSSSGEPTPLRFSGGASTARLLTSLEWADSAWTDARPVVREHCLALPLVTDSQVVAMLLADCGTPPDSTSVDALVADLAPQVLQLHAALLFGDVRDAATSEERQRLAREVHDGVAQDVASLGYLVDNMTEAETDPSQLAHLHALRSELTRVVSELRHSVFDLRNDTGSGQGLGQSISSFARHVGSHSDLTIHVTLDEAAGRLRPEVESELLRIAQEAINNARKHSGGQNLWVRCEVRPPYAAIEVRDDGLGLGRARDDSHGLKIMRERADRIGAVLRVETPAEAGRGTCISIHIPVNAGLNERWMVPS